MARLIGDYPSSTVRKQQDTQKQLEKEVARYIARVEGQCTLLDKLLYRVLRR